MDLLITHQSEVPPYYKSQLQEVLKYSKAQAMNRSTGAAQAGSFGGNHATTQYVSLQSLPDLRILLSEIDSFRSGLKKKDWSQKSIEGENLSMQPQNLMLTFSQKCQQTSLIPILPC